MLRPQGTVFAGPHLAVGVADIQFSAGHDVCDVRIGRQSGNGKFLPFALALGFPKLPIATVTGAVEQHRVAQRHKTCIAPIVHIQLAGLVVPLPVTGLLLVDIELHVVVATDAAVAFHTENQAALGNRHAVGGDIDRPRRVVSSIFTPVVKRLASVGDIQKRATGTACRQRVAVVDVVIDLVHGKLPSCRVDGADAFDHRTVTGALHHGALQRADGKAGDVAIVLHVFRFLLLASGKRQHKQRKQHNGYIGVFESHFFIYRKPGAKIRLF